MYLPSFKLKVVFLTSALTCLPFVPHIAASGDAAPTFSFSMAFAQESGRAAQAAQRAAASRSVKADERPQNASSIESTAILECDEKHQPTEFTLPGSKGAMKIDRCYRGREHFVCRINTLNSGSKSLIEDYRSITSTRYPDFANLDAICALPRAKIASDLDMIGKFPLRFSELRGGYESQVSCATSLERSIKEANLGDLPQAKEVVASLEEAVQFDLKDLPDNRKNLFELAVNIDASLKALVVIEKIHLAMCRPN